VAPKQDAYHTLPSFDVNVFLNLFLRFLQTLKN
ncbi:MAG: hypothetical protein ACJAXJ_002104, partial [Colwellia sp.]